MRVGDASGKILFVGTLREGQSARLSASAFWLRVGAAAYLDATLNGKPVRLGTGTFDSAIAP